MFIQTEATPNPQTLKFLPGRDVLPGGAIDYPTPADGVASPLARRLFAVRGVRGVFLGSDFIAVTKDDTDWAHLKPRPPGRGHGTLHVRRAGDRGRGRIRGCGRGFRRG